MGTSDLHSVNSLNDLGNEFFPTASSKEPRNPVPGASVRNPARDKVMRKEADIRKACSDFRGPSGNS